MYQDCPEAIRSAVLDAIGTQRTIEVYDMAHKLHAAYPHFTELELAHMIGKIVAEVPGSCALWEPSKSA